MMRKFWFILIALSVLLSAGSCSRLDERTTALNIYVRLPEDGTTKADWQKELAKESRITDLKIWVFVSNESAGSLPKGLLLGYLEPKQLNFSEGKIQKFTIPLDKDQAEALDKVDVYVLGNTKAAGLGESYTSADYTAKEWKTVTPAELDGLVLSDDLFGIRQTGRPTNETVDDSYGLPYSAVAKGLALKGTKSELSVDNVELVRAVSKVMFVFSQITVGGKKVVDFEITGLQLAERQIAVKEYLFNDSANAFKIWKDAATAEKSYVGGILNFPVDALTKENIVGRSDPSKFAYQPGADPLAYQNDINNDIIGGGLTLGPVCYLRESDKALQGVIKYKLGGPDEKSMTFSMTGAFARNDNWIVYFYFNNDVMSISVVNTNWIAADPVTIIGD